MYGWGRGEHKIDGFAYLRLEMLVDEFFCTKHLPRAYNTSKVSAFIRKLDDGGGGHEFADGEDVCGGVGG